MRGASPLTRGKPYCGCGPSDLCGRIPAHAGKTPVPTFRSAGDRAHPRSRGENTRFCNEILLRPGASPLTRGKPLGAALGKLALGRIPAHAGKTRPMPSGTRAPRAHPRSRGENLKNRGLEALEPGASPLTRGKLPRRGGADYRARRIPAHAGKTRCKSSKPTSATAHPRSRGENQ